MQILMPIFIANLCLCYLYFLHLPIPVLVDQLSWQLKLLSTNIPAFHPASPLNPPDSLQQGIGPPSVDLVDPTIVVSLSLAVFPPFSLLQVCPTWSTTVHA
jgi:hypothetical protein